MDLPERKGSLSLRSQHMPYGKTVLVSDWHETIQAEPKDYDINAAPLGTKNLCNSSYWRFGVEDKVCKSEMHEQMAKIYLKPSLEQNKMKPLLNEDTLCTGVIERASETTYRADYVPPYDYKPAIPPFLGNYSVAHRKCRSQFTDVEDGRRRGFNRWHDESGIYGNSDVKQKVFPATNPITSHL
ncbi:protein C9orf135 homolog isoform X2 [Tachyglossus aculeatus]|uniref:protein C9orf135 homolog isoform X2 n=1 Tax=Tachyglossus aculeatus TaxID=9261 RepID=UPI0018F6FA6D|nr:protein C9orf135 homolog isoform X2 [Tachyglossus aculeatus]